MRDSLLARLAGSQVGRAHQEARPLGLDDGGVPRQRDHAVVPLHAELAARRTRWDAAAEALGFDEANRQELEAWREQEEAVRAVFRVRAATLAGVEAKLALMIQLCATFSDDPDFPLPQLRSTLADVKYLRRALDALRC